MNRIAEKQVLAVDAKLIFDKLDHMKACSAVKVVSQRQLAHLVRCEIINKIDSFD